MDRNDPVLGFFHRWVEEFAKHFEHIHVVCLREGKHALPGNVSVHSLGKESGESRLKYIARFYRCLFLLRGKYDRVFVHMNPHYVLLGGLYWKLVGVPIFFWRNHAKMNWMTRIAAPLSKRVFHTSPFACTARYAHAVKMPVGIDTKLFVPAEKELVSSNTKKVLFLGRISPVKRVELFFEAGKVLGDEYELHVYGDAPKHDREYATRVRNSAPGNVHFHPGIKNTEAPDIYRAHDVYVNLTPDGSMDKTVLEAVACGVPTVAVNRSFVSVLPPSWIPERDTPESIAVCIERVVSMSDTEQSEALMEARSAVEREHSLSRLGDLLYTYINTP